MYAKRVCPNEKCFLGATEACLQKYQSYFTIHGILSKPPNHEYRYEKMTTMLFDYKITYIESL